MGSCIWLISDTHFGHANILTFKRADGSLLRPGFANVEEMNEHMIAGWNKVVRPQDKVYHLGDFGMGLNPAQQKQIVQRLNGHKRLVLGNHDDKQVQNLMAAGFQEVYGSRQFEGMIMTHIPIHTESLSRWKLNVHGHLHANRVRLSSTNWAPDPRYFNVSVEQLDYKPISLEEIRAKTHQA